MLWLPGQRAAKFGMLLCMGLAAARVYSQQPSAAGTGAAESDKTEQAIADLKQNQPQKALDLLTEVLGQNPNDAAASLLAASAAIELNQPALAVTYGERARALEPSNWKVDTTLVTAYAMASKTTERDAMRASLRALHAAAKEPDAKQASGFLLDRFRVKQYSVDAVEYFAPVGKFHIYYCFFVRNDQGRRLWQISVQSDGLNQASWAKAYPQQAAEGQRQFQLTGEGNGVRTDYRSFSGSPDYDWIKSQVGEIIKAQPGPFPGESAEEHSQQTGRL